MEIKSLQLELNHYFVPKVEILNKEKAPHQPSVSERIYLPMDVSAILKLEYYKVKYLMNTFWHCYTFGEKRNKAIIFVSLIEFYSFYHLKNTGFSSKKIKDN